ncbi:MAG: hypothetical protein EPN22_16495 [Nitrospirae bacterium]|nr:MAG: hypothetical protein EPN22_16495 [Nitrospirota bacterium]
MSTYIPLGKNPASPEERKKLIGEKVCRDESLENDELARVQSRTLDFLMFQKGYCKIDLQEKVLFKIELPDASFDALADIVITLNGRRFILVKCAVNSPASWERYSVAFCRVADVYQIPYAVVTDGEDAKLLDAVRGRPISEGLESIPSKDEAIELFGKTEFMPFPAQKAEREKRILFAFDTIKYSSLLVEPE